MKHHAAGRRAAGTAGRLVAAGVLVAVSGVFVAQAADTEPSHYAVEAADTWQSIAAAHGVTADGLQVANNVAASTSNGAHPRTGWILHVPVASVPGVTATSTSTTSPAPLAPSTTAPAGSVTTIAAASTVPAATTTTTTMPMNHDCAGMSYTPIGALPPATPMFCIPLAARIRTTFVDGTNSWVDDFNHGASMAALGAGYREYSGGVERAAGFRHANHWMADLRPHSEPATVGGHYLRPDRSFRFEDGVLVVEMDVAAGILAYDGHPNLAWPEIVVSTGGTPRFTGPRPDEGYAYGAFPGEHTVGVRLDDQVPIAALFNDAASTDIGVVRTWERSFFQLGAGGVNEGGYPDYARGVWRTCAGTDPDTDCRDRFRLELRKDSITLHVNGQLYWRQTNLPPADQLPAAMLDGDVYVYAASWISTREDRVHRFHWDRFAVNP